MNVITKLSNVASLLADIKAERKRFERAHFDTNSSLVTMRHLFKDMENAVGELQSAVESIPLSTPKEKT